MRANQRISLVIPCLNEERGLRVLLPEVPPWVDEVIVVDNNSTDQTADVGRAHGATVVSEKIQGYGAAHQAGLRRSSGDIVAALDGDGQYPVPLLAKIVDPIATGHVDFVVGSRVPFPPGSIPLTRRIGNILLNVTGALLFGTVVKDNQSGMWAMRRRVFKQLDFQRTDMAFSEEIKYKTIRAGFRFREVHIGYRSRCGGASKLLPLTDGIRNLLYLIHLRFGTTARKTARTVRMPERP